MSAELMIKAFEIVENDERLNPMDKLVLLRWAWKSTDGQPYEIKYREMARALGASRNGVKNAVRHLVDCGYLTPVAVKVVAGPIFQTGHSVTRHDQKQTGHSVTRKGSLSDPQKGHSVTHIQRKDKKEEPCGAYSDLDLSKLTPYQKKRVRDGATVVVNGKLYGPNGRQSTKARCSLL